MKLLRDERGSVTAEFALVIPAMLAVLVLVLGGVYLAAERVALVSLAGDLARLEARGDQALAAARLAGERTPLAIAREADGRVLCITATTSPRSGLLAAITITGRGCAAVADATR